MAFIDTYNRWCTYNYDQHRIQHQLPNAMYTNDIYQTNCWLNPEISVKVMKFHSIFFHNFRKFDEISQWQRWNFIGIVMKFHICGEISLKFQNSMKFHKIYETQWMIVGILWYIKVVKFHNLKFRLPKFSTPRNFSWKNQWDVCALEFKKWPNPRKKELTPLDTIQIDFLFISL